MMHALHCANDTKTSGDNACQHSRSKHSLPLWDDALIRRHDLTGPRYTSYPTAPQFSDDFTEQNWQSAMARSNATGNPLSLYVHIPFCDTVCYYCGCNKIITADKQRAEPYLKALHTEIDMQAAQVDTCRPLLQLHFGGGTPTYISDDQLKALMSKIQQHFNWQADDSGEYSIEIHPQTVTPERLGFLRALGFNRLSLGVQDFNPRVQKAVNRFNSEQEVKALIIAARRYQYKAISLDLIYGLPHQTCESFATTLDQVIALRPDRLSLFNYAHMPELFKVQKQIDAQALPEPQDKLQMLHDSIIQLTRAGYIYIGMDHFALPDDELAILQAQGALHRNFQGYATHGNCDLIAFGVSAINALDNTFAQNHKTIEPYIAAINTQQLPIHRGLTLTDDDLLRKAVINQLICHFTLDYPTIEKAFGIDFGDYFTPELVAIKTLGDDNLLDIHAHGFTVKATGRLLIRRICMVFDRYLQASPKAPKYSRII